MFRLADSGGEARTGRTAMKRTLRGSTGGAWDLETLVSQFRAAQGGGMETRAIHHPRRLSRIFESAESWISSVDAADKIRPAGGAQCRACITDGSAMRHESSALILPPSAALASDDSPLRRASGIQAAHVHGRAGRAITSGALLVLACTRPYCHRLTTRSQPPETFQ